MNDADRRLMDRLGHRFSDPQLLEQAMTHRSAGGRNNERLEFLGDAILNFVVADTLYRANPEAHEGRLTRLRAHLVRRETLAGVARELDLGEALRLGPGELKSGGRGRDSILSDALEALLGALYLDAGTEVCREAIERLYADRIVRAGEIVGLKDAKTRLQEALQSRGLGLPEYRVIEVEGAAHDQSFTVECRVPALAEPRRGSGTSRRKAEQDAARRALEAMEDEG